ncbi:hypothetical protein [Metapseudomonas boanensis]|uniref:Uncharacterized protein n=1 Tax=Metapseudomonas boanensis TaxID=2822138 RepID=A0ABS5XDQ9_9GAMM|nr:hypothetical protein [Pseudomonas boanensis]MBT8765824.1 hypothetical protein [Pseudomonas boanensis]
MNNLNQLCALLLLTASSLSYAVGPSTVHNLCTSGEEVIFNCRLNDATASFCFSGSSKITTYRYGNAKKLDLLMQQDEANKSTFFISNATYIGGGETHVRFNNKNHTYIIFDKTIREDGWPTFSAGIVVFKSGHKQAQLECTNDASIGERAYKILIREQFMKIEDSLK